MEDIRSTYESSYYDIIDNTDAYNDHITRLAARSLTRKKLLINSIDERVNDIDANIAESGISDSSHYERIAMQRVINEKIKSIDKGISKLTNLYNNRSNIYSKQAYKREVNALREQKARLLRRLGEVNNLFDISSFENEDIAQMLKNAQDYYDNFIKDNVTTTTSFENLSDSLQRELYSKANYQLYKEDLQSELPQTDNTKDYYKQLYDDTEATLIGIADSKFNDAFETVQNYLKTQDNPVQSLENILKDDVQDRKLKNALELLQFGAYNRQEYNNMLNLMLMSEVAKRERENANQSEVEGEQPSESVSNVVEEKINESVSSSTGEEQVNQQTPVEETSTTPTDDDTSAFRYLIIHNHPSFLRILYQNLQLKKIMTL